MSQRQELGRQLQAAGSSAYENLHREHFTGPSLHVTRRDYPRIVEEVKAELHTRSIRSLKQNSETVTVSDTAREIVDRAQARAEARYEEYSEKSKHGRFIARTEANLGKIPFFGAILAAPQNLLVHNWMKRQAFDAEQIHFSTAVEIIGEEAIPGLVDLRSLAKAIYKLIGVQSWHGGKRTRTFAGAVDDFVGMLPAVPEKVVEFLDDKFAERATIPWAHRNRDQFVTSMTDIEVARELTRIRHENRHGTHVGETVAKLIVGGSRT